MNCDYCQKPLKFSHHENNKEVGVYDCNSCPIQVVFYYSHLDGTKIKTTFMINKNEKLYMWTNHHVKQVSYITDVSQPYGKIGTDPVIIKFPKIMNIIPSNAREKFSFYMVFL